MRREEGVEEAVVDQEDWLGCWEAWEEGGRGVWRGRRLGERGEEREGRRNEDRRSEGRNCIALALDFSCSTLNNTREPLVLSLNDGYWYRRRRKPRKYTGTIVPPRPIHIRQTQQDLS